MSRLAYVVPSLKLGSQTGEKADVPKKAREALDIPLLPRHMHPKHHAERRAARTKAPRKQLKNTEGVVYLDAARHGKGRDAMAAAVVDKQGKIIASCSVMTPEPEVGVEVAIALAIRTQQQTAIRSFANRRISPVTRRVFGDLQTHHRVKLIWTPAHSSLPGNNRANDAARGLTRRAGTTSEPFNESWLGGDRLVTFRDILDHYASERLRYPPARFSLDRKQATARRRPQTDTYPSPAKLSRWYPDRNKGECKLCGGRANPHHMVWECNKIDRQAQPLLTQIIDLKSWEAILLSTDPHVQTESVRLAKDAGGIQGIRTVV
ncbi:hypothetical protein HPB47_025882 [Ixodes persulcatus]|uniref:Uncharacterized protein n=1 Tax=Ixodes persulcatus TaxID=34615 RepID=A0AC60Q2N6_IXOPE|nr:hypothetical protein HPB47_025882 [Ixodes persulcatus]